MLNCTFAELEDRMDSSEFTQWQVIYGSEPSEIERIEAYLRLICTCIYDVNIPADKPRTKLMDFALEWKSPKDEDIEKQSSILGILTHWAAQQNEKAKAEVKRLVQPNKKRKRKQRKKDNGSSSG